ncbi:MAG TPA: T9SS type A sorting domain-containing protein, partial [Bacteroidia bacterium]
SEFFDTIVNPDSRWAKYRISMTDVCGMEGPLCAEHKTIHLSLQPSTSTSHNLIWDAYEGNSFAFYHIFRKANLSGSWVLVDSVPSAVTTYSDVTFNPLDTNYYHIDVSPPQGGCIATIKYPDIMATNLNTSRSNVYRVTDSSAVAVHEINYAGSVSVYPNPSKGAFTVQIFNQHVSGADVNIANVLGEKIYSIKMNSSRADIDLSDRAGGIYFITIKTQEGIAKKKIIINK